MRSVKTDSTRDMDEGGAQEGTHAFEGVSADGRRTPVVEGALGCCNLSCVPFLIIVRYLLREHLWNYCEVAITA